MEFDIKDSPIAALGNFGANVTVGGSGSANQQQRGLESRARETVFRILPSQDLAMWHRRT
jgi:hypothetical protein